ncbi:CATRA system-associated protein [Actinoplanes sp. CA-054009]
MEHRRYRERVQSLATLRLSERRWESVRDELKRASVALAEGDEAELAQAMTVLQAFLAQRGRRPVNPDMGTPRLSPMPELVRAVANDLVHRLTPDEPPPSRSAGRPVDGDDADPAGNH